jgi:hypothetical protein
MPNLGDDAALRDRANRLADAGRCANWAEIAEQLELQGVADAAKKLCADPDHLRELDARCARARALEQ